MKRTILLLLCLLLTGCSNSEEDGYKEVRKAGWNFIKQNKWENRVSGGWEQAKVEAYTVDKGQAQFMDEQYIGDEVLRVEFEDRANTAAGAPVILVDQETKRVIGYLPGE
ncbi:hypothetical protein [Metabacillus indicus]|uniref:Lipoprotein n=1 Tax=Metabacillus indicus TaxID=246786 RepID=A0A084H228_METID|nr:hypothetical protein [Metabacillus indicus]KEZ52444.1 hypothetical protein AZ46_0201265 [Metabacillus indicus LMG 22858]KEZ53640.1 hypothetical protein GS18_0201260 [Metabacillus indicus]